MMKLHPIIREVSKKLGRDFSGNTPLREIRSGEKVYSGSLAFRIFTAGERVKRIDLFEDYSLTPTKQFAFTGISASKAASQIINGFSLKEKNPPPPRVQKDSYGELEREIKFFVKGKFNLKNLLVISGPPGVGKSEAIHAIAAKHLGVPIQTKMPAVRGLTSAQVSKIQKDRADWDRLSDEDKQTTPEPESVGARLDKVSQHKQAFRGVIYKGSQDLTAYKLYIELYKANGETILYDDSSASFYRMEDVQEKLNHATNTNPKHRVITYASEGGALRLKDGSGVIPIRFQFTGKIIIITNRKISDLPDYIQSRAIRVIFKPSNKEMIGKLDDVAAGMKKEFPEVDSATIDFVIDWLKAFTKKRPIKKYSHRLITDLLYTKEKYEDEPDKFDQAAKSIIKQFYSGNPE